MSLQPQPQLTDLKNQRLQTEATDVASTEGRGSEAVSKKPACEHCNDTGQCYCISCGGQCAQCAWNMLPEREKERRLDRLGRKGSREFKELIEKIRKGVPL